MSPYTSLAALILALLANDSVPNEQVVALAWGDFNNDELPDVYLSVPNGADRLLRNLGGGKFEQVALHTTAKEGSYLARWQDIDNDGDLDLFVATVPGPGRLLLNLGAGLFEPLVDGLPVGLALGPIHRATWLDFDRDSSPDLLLEGVVTSALLRNDGQGGLTPVDLAFGTDSIPTLSAGVPVTDQGGQPAAGHSGTVLGALSAISDERANVSFGGVSNTRTSSVLYSAPIGGSVPLLAGGICAASLRDQSSPGNCLTASTTPQIGKLYPLSFDLSVHPTTGWVGLGTANPVARLHVAGDILSTGDITADESVRIGGGFFTGISSPKTGVLDILAGGANRIHITAAGDIGVGTTSPGAALELMGDLAATELRAAYGTSTVPTYRFGSGIEDTGLSSPASEALSIITNGVERVRVNSVGKVGVGTTSPSGALDVVGSGIGVSGAALRSTNSSSAQGIAIYAHSTGTDSTMVLSQAGSGSILRAFNGGSGPVFEIKNSGRCVTTALQITGGGDLVEGFDAGTHEVSPGTVVCIDPDRPGKLRPANLAYDTSVAGVVSGAGGVKHGIRMGQDDVLDGDTLVAMTGRVYVHCTVDNGSILPGDLLTTSDVLGHAMKATDAARSFGAVIGKAMSPLQEGRGLVLVLVNLQ